MFRHLATALLLLTPAAAFATDGAIEINQAKVLASGGFPFVVNEPGSYRLTSNLIVPDANTHAISIIQVRRVTIDLNGFSILGPVDCGTMAGGCPAAGTGDGIHAMFGGDHAQLRVRNGNIKGMGNYGIYIAGDGVFEDLTVSHCAGGGMVIAGIAQNIKAEYNGTFGIALSSGQISNSTAMRNGTVGIIANFAVVTGNVIYGNLGIGIQTGYSVVRDNVSAINGGVELDLTSSAWQGNLLYGCAPSACVSGVGPQLGSNACEGGLCPP